MPEKNEALLTKERLGDGDVFVRRTKTGIIKAVQAVLTLAEENGEIAVIQGKAMTTAKGFHKANSITSLSVITPPKLQLPSGEIVVNPYPIIEQKSGSIQKVWVKKMVVGYSPIGVLAVSSATLLYDIRVYFTEELLKALSKNKTMGRICREEDLSEEDKKNGLFVPVDDFFGVYARYDCIETLDAMKNYMRKKVFAERNAQSICERMAMGRHPALAHIVYVNADGPKDQHKAKVSLIGFVHDLSKEEMLDISEQAERGEEIRVRGQKAEVVEEVVVTATADEIRVEADPEEEAVAEQPEPEETIRQEEDLDFGKAPDLFDMGGLKL